MSKSSSDDGLFIIVVIITAVVALGVFKFSEAIGVEWEVGLTIIGRMALVLIFWGAWRYLRAYNYYETPVWPIALAGIIWAWFPAIDVWSVQENQPILGDFGYTSYEASKAWWSEWYVKCSAIVVTLVAGYYRP